MKLFSVMAWIFPQHVYQTNVAAALVGTAVVGSALAPDPPDPNQGMQAAADSNKEVGMAQVQLARDQFDYSKERNAKLDDLTAQVTQQQIDSMKKNDALADDYANYNKTTFRPLEQSMVAEAQNAGGATDQEAAAGRAGATVQQQVASQRAASARELARMGVNPNSGRFAASVDEQALGAAVATAGAENSARQQAKDLGWAKRMDAASLGRNLPSAQATSAGIALNAGNSAVSNQAAANASANQSAATTASIYGGATSAFNGAASASNMAAAQAAAIYGTQAQANSSLFGAIGSGLGSYYRINRTK